MPLLADLHRAVDATLATGRLGTPVFLRYHLQNLDDNVERTLSRWMGETPTRLSRLAAAADGAEQTVSLYRFPRGTSALVTQAQGSRAEPGVDLMLLGNRGALYHAYDAGHVWHLDEKPAAPSPEPVAPRKAPYGVLLVTGGHTHQENYAAAFAADKRCRLVALTDEPDVDPRRRRLNERLARALNIPHIADLAEALKREDVQIVCVCTEPERRGRVIVRCAEAGKHLYLDKSLTPQLAEADAIVAAVRKAGVRSQMFSFVTAPWARRARRLLEEQRCGKLLAIHADVFFAKGKTGTARLAPRKEEYPPQRHQLIEAKREMDNVGVYALTLVRWLTGRKFATVRGLTGNYFFQEHQKHDVEDFGLIAGTLDDRTPVTISSGRYGWTSHPAGGVNRLVLVGSARTLIVDASRPRLEVSTDEPPWAPPNVNPADPMGFWQSTQDEVHVRPKTAWVPLAPAGASDATHFLDALDAGRDGDVSAAEAALTTEVLLAAYRSAAQGTEVTLPLPR